MPSEILTVVIAAAAGFLTSLSIEFFRAFNENVKSKQQRAQKEIHELRKFLARDSFDSNRPIARLLISGAYKIKQVRRIPNPKIEIGSVNEITSLINKEEESIDNESQSSERKSLPEFSVPVCRRYYLRYSDNPNYAYVWQIREQVRFLGKVTTIGRDDRNEVVLDDSRIRLRFPKMIAKEHLTSRYHAIIRYEGDRFVIYDLASTNPTQVNGEAVRYAALKEGDIIEIGSFIIEFQQNQYMD